MKKIEKNENFGFAVAKFKNVTEEEAVNLAGDKILRTWNKEIRDAKSAIEKAKTIYEEGKIDREQELIERESAYFNSFLDVNAKSVSSVEQRDAFIKIYENNVSRKSVSLSDYKKYLETLEKELTGYVDAQQKIVDQYKGFISDREKAIADLLGK